MTDREFDLIRAMVRRESGIFLSDAKKALLSGRLSRRVRQLGLGSFGAYYRLLAEGDATEKAVMIDCVSTNETRFFREPRQFDFLEQRILPEWKARAAAGRRPQRIHAWSAACSTGEEPYSLAMSLLECFPPGSGWDIAVLATDISRRALAQARTAVWPRSRAGTIPERHLKAFMLEGTASQAGKVKAGREIRSVVRFDRINLNAPDLPIGQRFDLILCRNVLIYFDAATKARLVRRLFELLEVGGYLLLGHAESLTSHVDCARAVGPTVYVPAERGER
jgi:chemotaxis protein methyltransferase CheR